MQNKKIMMRAIFLVSLLAVSAVSAEDNATSDVVSEGDSINLDDENVLAVEETADEPVGEPSVDEDLICDGELTADDWNYYIPSENLHCKIICSPNKSSISANAEFFMSPVI